MFALHFGHFMVRSIACVRAHRDKIRIRGASLPLKPSRLSGSGGDAPSDPVGAVLWRFNTAKREVPPDATTGGTEWRSKIELFLSDLAVSGCVSAPPQNQSFNALWLPYREVEESNDIGCGRRVLASALRFLSPYNFSQKKIYISGIRGIKASRYVDKQQPKAYCV
jgi:hypothetical protein